MVRERADKRADKQMNKDKTTRTFEHRGEAWRVLAMQRYELFPNIPSLLLKNGVVLNFLLVFLSQIGKKLVPLPLVIRFCYKDAFKHFATLKRQAHASSCKSMNVSFEEVK